MTKEKAIEELGYDIIPTYICDILKDANVNMSVNECSVTYFGEKFEPYEKPLDDFAKWLTEYKNINKPDRLNISDVAIVNSNERYCHGVIQIFNGLNGTTLVSRQSLKHVMDIIQHLEDYFGARAWISQVSYHSDCFCYAISFVFWDDYFHVIRDGINGQYGTFRPLYHWD